MSTQTTPKKVLYANHQIHPTVQGSRDMSDGKREDFHLAIVDGVLTEVSDGVTDYVKLVQSHANEAGLVNILKLQELRYGTIDNAIARNKEKQVFADVSGIPDSVAEQQALVAQTNAEIDKLCADLGLTREQLLNLTPEKYIEIKNAQAAAAAASVAASNEGGQE